jgi:hypothetical protein
VHVYVPAVHKSELVLGTEVELGPGQPVFRHIELALESFAQVVGAVIYVLGLPCYLFYGFVSVKQTIWLSISNHNVLPLLKSNMLL